MKSDPNILGTKRTSTRVHYTFPEDSKILIIEEHKDVKVIPSTQHSTIGNHQPIPQPKPVHSPDIGPSPDDPPQDVDKSHLSESTSTTTNLNESCSLDTSCDHLLHLDSPSLSSELQDTSSVESVEIEFVPDFEEPLESNKFSPADDSVYNMTMTCSYSIKRLILHLTISTIRTLMSVKSKVKMTSSFMPLDMFLSMV